MSLRQIQISDIQVHVTTTKSYPYVVLSSDIDSVCVGDYFPDVSGDFDEYISRSNGTIGLKHPTYCKDLSITTSGPLGLQFSTKSGDYVVDSVNANSSASSAGVCKGDILKVVGSFSVSAVKWDKVSLWMRDRPLRLIFVTEDDTTDHWIGSTISKAMAQVKSTVEDRDLRDFHANFVALFGQDADLIDIQRRCGQYEEINEELEFIKRQSADIKHERDQLYDTVQTQKSEILRLGHIISRLGNRDSGRSSSDILVEGKTKEIAKLKLEVVRLTSRIDELEKIREKYEDESLKSTSVDLDVFERCFTKLRLLEEDRMKCIDVSAVKSIVNLILDSGDFELSSITKHRIENIVGYSGINFWDD